MKPNKDIFSSCDISDMMNEIHRFTLEQDDHDDTEFLSKLGVAISILCSICTPAYLTEEEYQFILQLRGKVSTQLGYENLEEGEN